jgi:hypothetical protein
MNMTIFMSTEDGEKNFTSEVNGPKTEPLALATKAFRILEEEGGADLVAVARENQSYQA